MTTAGEAVTGSAHGGTLRPFAIATSQLTNQASTLLVMVLAARQLAPSDYGLFALALATAMTISLIPGVGLDWAAVRISGTHAGDPRRADNTLMVGAYAKIVCAMIVSLIVLAVGCPIALFMTRNDGVALALLVGSVASFGIAITNYSMSTLQARLDESRFIALSFASAFAKVCVFVAFTSTMSIGLPGAYVLYLVPLTAMAAASSSVALGSLKPSSTARWPVFRELIQYARWLALAALLGTALSSLDIYSVTFFADSETLGHYAAARTLAMGLGAVAVVSTATLLPRASRITERNSLLRFAFLAQIALVVLVLLALTALLLAQFVFDQALGANYLSSVPAFRLLILAYSLDVLASPALVLVLVAGRPEWLTWINALVLVLTSVAFFVLLPGRGAEFAAGVTLGSRALLAAGTAAAAAYLLNKPLDSARGESFSFEAARSVGAGQ